MNSSFFANKYLILFLAFFNPMIIDIGGEVSPSFLFILITCPIWIRNVNIKNNKILKGIIQLLIIILAVQIIWIPFAHTELLIQIKGILVTAAGFLSLLFYYFVYTYNTNLIKWYVLGTFLASFVFINVLAEIDGGEFGLWKFHIMPSLVTGCLLIYLWTTKLKFMRKWSPILFIGIGGLGLATGARSVGLIPIISGLFAAILQINTTIHKKKIKKYSILLLLFLYSAYIFIYVPQVMNGNISGGNSKQLKASSNPYNPLNLLMVGRTDAIIPFIAFLDNPLTGWGYYTPDPNFKYHKLLSKIGNKKDTASNATEYKQNHIPGHSLLGYYACSYGVIVFIALILLIRKIWQLLYHSLIYRDQYFLYRIYLTIGITWNILFSPMSHFKTTLPVSIAIILVLSIKTIRANRTKGCSKQDNIEKQSKL